MPWHKQDSSQHPVVCALFVASVCSFGCRCCHCLLCVAAGMNVSDFTARQAARCLLWCSVGPDCGWQCLVTLTGCQLVQTASGSHRHLDCLESSQTVPAPCHRHGCGSKGDHPGPRVWPAGGAGSGACAEPGAQGAAGHQHCRRVHGGPPAGQDWQWQHQRAPAVGKGCCTADEVMQALAPIPALAHLPSRVLWGELSWLQHVTGAHAHC